MTSNQEILDLMWNTLTDGGLVVKGIRLRDDRLSVLTRQEVYGMIMVLFGVSASNKRQAERPMPQLVCTLTICAKKYTTSHLDISHYGRKMMLGIWKYITMSVTTLLNDGTLLLNDPGSILGIGQSMTNVDPSDLSDRAQRIASRI